MKKNRYPKPFVPGELLLPRRTDHAMPGDHDSLAGYRRPGTLHYGRDNDDFRWPQQRNFPPYGQIRPSRRRPAPILLSEKVNRSIVRLIGAYPPERGGMLGGDWESRRVTHFYFDRHADTGAAAYTPNIAAVNAKLKHWNAEGVRLMGFVHSHPRGMTQPSWADVEYASRLLAHNEELPALLMPIVQSANRGRTFSMHGYACVRSHRGVDLVPMTFGYNDED